jgi:hypothetical protein
MGVESKGHLKYFLAWSWGAVEVGGENKASGPDSPLWFLGWSQRSGDSVAKFPPNKVLEKWVGVWNRGCVPWWLDLRHWKYLTLRSVCWSESLGSEDPVVRIMLGKQLAPHSCWGPWVQKYGGWHDERSHGRQYFLTLKNQTNLYLILAIFTGEGGEKGATKCGSWGWDRAGCVEAMLWAPWQCPVSTSWLLGRKSLGKPESQLFSQQNEAMTPTFLWAQIRCCTLEVLYRAKHLTNSRGYSFY